MYEVCTSHSVFVFRSYTGPVVDGSLRAQRENPEMSVRNTDAGLRGAKKRLEQLMQVSGPVQSLYRINHAPRVTIFNPVSIESVLGASG